MRKREKPDQNPWTEITKFLFVEIPWGVATLMVYLFGISIAMLSIVAAVKIIIMVVVGFTDDIPFYIM